MDDSNVTTLPEKQTSKMKKFAAITAAGLGILGVGFVAKGVFNGTSPINPES